MKRREFIGTATAGIFGAFTSSLHASLLGEGMQDALALREAARRCGILLGVFAGQHMVTYDAGAQSLITEVLDLVGDGNDLKFSDRLRPTPDQFDFSYGDAVLSWAQKHKILFRGHCLVWWNVLPHWFAGFVNPENARQIMVDHIHTVVGHYKGSIYSWDVVNEPIYHDSRPDGLRKKPWLDLIGPDYIDIAFHAAHEADPDARLVLNECFIEHNTATERARRASLLQLTERLTKAGVPITHVGIQGHLRGNTPLDAQGLTDFCYRIRNLGLEIMVTEMDVDTVAVPIDHVTAAVSDKYREFVELMAPHISLLALQALYNDPGFPRKPDGSFLSSYLFDDHYHATPNCAAVLLALNSTAHKRGIQQAR